MFFSSVPLFPGRCIGATILISRSLRSWPLRCLFPSHCGVGGYDAYFQVAAGLAVTTLIPRSATEIGAGLERLISRSLHVGWRLRYSQIHHRDWSDTYFQVAVGLAVTTLIPRSVTEIGATLISMSLWGWWLRRLFPGP